ncbi:DNA damage-inducible transcript 4-like protein isoform X1 [Oncorhynchus tshawytscha]|uniref:DNA damage-inducible transcript 4-like protein n=1 Tax=Oncorhynchus tshawytscha TaxID=74940 RepID=A0A8C8BUR0_ONCTS|nr:DNA damage-inducible transcript 4-like protein isoform X1 [Oncorhynchus tshawytscha]XP_042184368.1 DNA damage-inducible transcript 4-like protein isoform X1 [Oncorhynchus tshawytscha]
MQITLKKELRVVAMVATSKLKSKNPEFISELIDRRYDQTCIENELDSWDHSLAEPHLNVEVSEDRMCQQLAKMLENCLSRAKKTTMRCSKVLVPEKLTLRIARDVLRLSSGEPCGLRGCVLYVHLEQEQCCKQLERIVYNADVVPTFELTLVFKQDCSAWPSLRDFLHIGACFTPGFRHALKLSPGFRLIKKKLYSSLAGTVVEEY